MTFVGKILVIVIMAFSLLFLGISTVVFTTEKNWRAEAEKVRAEVKKQDQKNKNLAADVAAAKKDLENAKKAAEAAEKTQTDRVTALEAETKRALADMTEARTALTTAQQTAKTALDEAAFQKQETDTLRKQKSDVEKQANEYKLRQTELNDKIRELSRMLETATNNAKDLRDRMARYQTLLRSKGLSDDISQVKGLESPPVVDGKVLRVDARNRRLQLSIGSDDGLVVGHELHVFRTTPRAEYLGKVRIISVDPDQALAEVIGSTVQGKKIKEGDIVSSTTRPRS